jgi:hypothetical protein
MAPHVVKISSNEAFPCPWCQTYFLDGTEKFNAACDHLIDKHDFKLKHVGTETIAGSEGAPWHTTVAVLVASGSSSDDD